MSNTRVIVFDFDGVLTVGGEILKREAWELLAVPGSAEFRAALRCRRDDFAAGRLTGSRYDILRAALEQIGCREPALALLVNAYAEAYNQLVQALLSSSGMPDGTLELLRAWSARASLYVNSATPERAVRDSLEKSGAAGYFRDIFGQPASKVDNLRRIMVQEKARPEDLVFIGDGDADWRAVQAVGCRFVGMVTDYNKWHDKPFPLIRALGELKKYL